MLKAVLQFAAIFFMRCVSFDSKIYVKRKFMRQLIYAVFRIACMTDQRYRERDPFTSGHPPLYLIHSSCPPFSRLSVELHPCETIVVAYFWSADQINMCVYDYDTRIVMLTHKYFYASATTLSRNR